MLTTFDWLIAAVNAGGVHLPSPDDADIDTPGERSHVPALSWQRYRVIATGGRAAGYGQGGAGQIVPAEVFGEPPGP